jgi:hypothetical protein
MIRDLRHGIAPGKVMQLGEAAEHWDGSRPIREIAELLAESV